MAETNSFVQIGKKTADNKFEGKKLRASDVVAVNGTSAEAHISDAAKHLDAGLTEKINGAVQSTEKGEAGGVATLGADGKVPASQLDLAKYQTSANVANYNELLALSEADAPVNSYVFVADATGDTTVKEGWAAYRRVAANGAAADWVKVSEGESLDIVIPDYETEINAAATEATKMDAVFVASEQELAAKDLRPGALVFMEVTNE